MTDPVPQLTPRMVSFVDQLEGRLDEIMTKYADANMAAQRGDFEQAERMMRELMHEGEELDQHELLNLFWTSVRMHYIDVYTWKKHMHDEHHGL